MAYVPGLCTYRAATINPGKQVYIYVLGLRYIGVCTYRAATCNPAHVYLHVQGLYVHVGLYRCL